MTSHVEDRCTFNPACPAHSIFSDILCACLSLRPALNRISPWFHTTLSLPPPGSLPPYPLSDSLFLSVRSTRCTWNRIDEPDVKTTQATAATITQRLTTDRPPEGSVCADSLSVRGCRGEGSCVCVCKK